MPSLPFARSTVDVSARHVHELVSEPVAEDYRALLQAALAHCDVALLDVGCSDMSQQGRRVVDLLRPFALATEDPEAASTLRFRFGRGSAALLAEAAPSLYAWQAPALPANLCLMRRGGGPWLLTLAAEAAGYLEISAMERALLNSTAPRLAALLANRGTHEATLALVERRFEESLERLAADLVEHGRATLDENREHLADVLQAWLLSGESARIAVALEVAGALNLTELLPEVEALAAEDEASIPEFFARHPVLGERWRARRRRAVLAAQQRLELSEPRTAW